MHPECVHSTETRVITTGLVRFQLNRSTECLALQVCHQCSLILGRSSFGFATSVFQNFDRQFGSVSLWQSSERRIIGFVHPPNHRVCWSRLRRRLKYSGTTGNLVSSTAVDRQLSFGSPGSSVDSKRRGTRWRTGDWSTQSSHIRELIKRLCTAPTVVPLFLKNKNSNQKNLLNTLRPRTEHLLELSCLLSKSPNHLHIAECKKVVLIASWLQSVDAWALARNKSRLSARRLLTLHESLDLTAYSRLLTGIYSS